MLNISNLNAAIGWLETAQTPLSKIAQTRVLKTDLALNRKADFAVDGGTLTASVGASGGFEIYVFNDAKDKDPERVLGELKTDARTLAGVDWRPQIDATDGVIRTAYIASFSVKAGISANIGATVGGISGDRELVLGSYCRQANPKATLLSVVRADLQHGLPSILDFAETRDLAEGNAVTMRIGGGLNASLTLAWAEVFAGALGSLTRELGSSVPLALKISAGAKLTATVAVRDDFQLAITRAPDAYTIAVRKLAQRTLGLGVTVGFEVSLSQASQNYLKGVASQVLDQLFAGATTVLERLQALEPATLIATAAATLPEALKPVLLQMTEQYALASAAPISKLIKRLDGKIKEIHEKISAVVSAKLKASFAFNYQRIATDGSILEVSMAALDALTHQQLVALNLGQFLARIQSGQIAATVNRYLHQTSLERSSTLGFSIGLGRWFNAKSLTTRKIREVWQTDIDGNMRLAQLGMLSYEDSWQGAQRSWSATLKADAAVFRKAPLREDFTLGIHLLANSDIDSLSNLADAFETALLFGVFDASGKATAHASLSGMDVVSTAVSFSLEGTSFNKVLHALSNLTAAQFGDALAAGMGIWSSVPARNDLAVRKHVYGPVWADVVSNGYQLSSTSLAFRVALRRAGFTNTDQQKEGGPRPIQAIGQLRPRSAARMAYDHSSLSERFENLNNAIDLLLSTTGDYPGALDDAFQRLFLRKSVFQNMFTLRAMAYLFSSLAERLSASGAEGYQATLTVTLVSGDQIVFGQH